MLMNKLALAALTVSLLGGVAAADRGRGGGERGGRVVERHENRGTITPRNESRGERHEQYRGDRHEYRGDRQIYVNHDNNRFYFRGGEYGTYYRPQIRERYYDYRYRPRLIVENYDPMPGYVWVQGGWQWNGAEWQWFGGHYEVDASYAIEGGY